jgi:hypothetical protein
LVLFHLIWRPATPKYRHEIHISRASNTQFNSFPLSLSFLLLCGAVAVLLTGLGFSWLVGVLFGFVRFTGNCKDVGKREET